MKMRLPTRTALLLLLTFFSLEPVSAQVRQFELFLAGKKIGDITAERKVKGDLEVITINSIASAQILWKDISTVTNTRVVCQAGKVSESFYEHKEDGEVEAYCKISPMENQYAVHHWKKGKYTLEGPASTSVLSIYFKEPVEGQRLFDESWGEYVTIKKTGTGQYEYKPKDGHKNVYRYANGSLIEADFHTSIATVKMRLKA